MMFRSLCLLKNFLQTLPLHLYVRLILRQCHWPTERPLSGIPPALEISGPELQEPQPYGEHHSYGEPPERGPAEPPVWLREPAPEHLRVPTYGEPPENGSGVSRGHAYARHGPDGGRRVKSPVSAVRGPDGRVNDETTLPHLQ